MTIYLYIKTHRVTGLKYFGKTTSDDPFKYKGHGVYWSCHIKKHGYNVETEIVGVFENTNDATLFALQFSKKNNIVESEEWANLQEENGIDGWPKGIPNFKSRGRKFSEEHIRRKSEAQRGMKFTKERCENISKARKGQPSSFKGKHHSEEALEKNAQAKRKTWVVTDPYGNEQTITNLIKFCNENNLSEDVMRKIARGKVKNHKGWRCSHSSSISI